MRSSPLRELRESDAAAVAALFVETYGEARRVDGEDIRSWLRNSEFEPGWLRVLEVDGRVAGYGDIWPQGDSVELDPVAPGHWDVFFDWAESEARDRGLPLVRLQIPHEHPLAEIAATRGYEQWRHSLTMEIELARRPEVTAHDFRAYRAEDQEALLAALHESFALDPFFDKVSREKFGAVYLGARGFDPSLWLLAWDGDELAGFSQAYAQHGSETDLGWVGSLGVRPAWRRHGLGEALLRASFVALYDHGLRRVGLGVDAANVTGALRLYERVGMRAVRRSDNWRKRL